MSTSDGWKEWNGHWWDRPHGCVDVVLRSGKYLGLKNAGTLQWLHLNSTTDIVKWRQA